MQQFEIKYVQENNLNFSSVEYPMQSDVLQLQLIDDGVRPSIRPTVHRPKTMQTVWFYFFFLILFEFLLLRQKFCVVDSHMKHKSNETKPMKTKPREEEEEATATVAVIGAAAAAAIEGETLGQQTDHHTDIPTNRYRHKLHLNPSRRRNNIRKLPGRQTDKLTRRKLHMKTGWIKNVHPWFTWKRNPKCCFLSNTLISIRCSRFHPVERICRLTDTSPVNL